MSVKRRRVKRSHRGVAQSGRAPALGAGGRRSESCHPDHISVRYGNSTWEGRCQACGTDTPIMRIIELGPKQLINAGPAVYRLCQEA